MRADNLHRLDRWRRALLIWLAAATIIAMLAQVGPALAGTGTITGRATGPDGRPLAGITVNLYINDEVLDFVFAETTTADDGSYSFLITSGSYLIEFVDPSGAYAMEFYGGAFRHQAAPVQVTDGPVPNISAQLDPAGAIAGIVTGIVTGPIAGAVVAAEVYDQARDRWRVAQRAETGADGAYTLRGLPTGASYKVSFFDPTLSFLGEYYDNKGTAMAANPVTVMPSRTTAGISAELARAGRISGRISAADGPQAGQGLGEVEVALLRLIDGSWATDTIAITNPDGSYTLPGIRPGAYRLRFSTTQGGYAAEYYNDKPRLADADPVQITDGAAITIDAALASASGPQLGILAGQVTNAQTGAGVPFAVVNLYRAGDNAQIRSLSADAQGGYRVADLPTGGYKVGVSAPGYQSEFYQNQASLAAATVVQVVVGEERRANIALDPAGEPPRGSMAGQVRDAAGGGMAGVEVHLYPFSDLALPLLGRAITAADGRYAFAELQPGQYLVYFVDPATGRDQFYQGAGLRAAATMVFVDGGQSVGGIDATFAAAQAPAALAESATGTVTPDLDTGRLSIAVPDNARSPLTISRMLSCAGGRAPEGASLALGEATFPMAAAAPGIYAATIAPGDLVDGPLQITYACPARAPQAVAVGDLAIVSRMGVVRDAASGRPIRGATVTLHQLMGWQPRSSPGDTRANTCESNLSKPFSQPWSQAVPAEGGVIAQPAPGRMSPASHTQVTGADGGFGWSLSTGCWYVRVAAPGYQPQLSKLAGSPPIVSGLDVALTPQGNSVPTLAFTSATYTVTEGAGEIVATVRLSGPAPLGHYVTVNYRTVGGSAVAPRDYTPLVGTLVFAPGQSTRPIRVPLLGQAIAGDRELRLELSDPAGAQVGTPSATLRIRDGGAAPQYRVHLPLLRR